ARALACVGLARPLRTASGRRRSAAGRLRGLLSPLADRCPAGGNGLPARPALRDGGHLAARLSAAGGGAAEGLRLLAAGALAGGRARGGGVPGRGPRLRGALPARAVLASLQLAGGAATHSVARAAVEVASATGRGSLQGDASARAFDFAGWFLAASLPLEVLA